MKLQKKILSILFINLILQVFSYPLTWAAPIPGGGTRQAFPGSQSANPSQEEVDRTLFGTDGIRGVAGVFPLTGEMAMGVGRAVAYLLQSQSDGRRVKIVIGRDTRISGDMIEQALVSGVCSMGADVVLVGVLPTPGIAFMTQNQTADAGIVISASHNPYEDNGIKIFRGDGYKPSDQFEAEVERLVLSGQFSLGFRPTSESHSPFPTGDQVGRVFRTVDAEELYGSFLKNLHSKELDLTGFRAVLDCANGAPYKVAPLVFEKLGVEVIGVGTSPNGININLNCGALYPENVARLTVENKADIGISLDGDGDRCILSDEKGNVLDGDSIIGICALEMAREGKLNHNTVVATAMTNMGLEQTLIQNGISMERVQIGDRHVVEALRKQGLNFGGEQSGHLVFLDHSTTGDGIVAGLKILEMMKRTGKPLSELKEALHFYPQVQEKVRVSRKEPFENFTPISNAIASAQSALQGQGRVFVRFSGTEPVARILVEGENLDQIKDLARMIASSIEKELG